MSQAQTESAISYARAGFRVGALNGKVAREKNWQDKDFTWPENIPEFMEGCIDGSFSAILNSDHLIIDADKRNYADGDDALKRLLADAGITKKELLSFAAIIRTGGGGWHIYMLKPKELAIDPHPANYKGLDIKTKGGYVVGAECIHESGQPYKLSTQARPLHEIKLAPAKLLALLAAKSKQKHRTGTGDKSLHSVEVGSSDDVEATVDKFKEILASCDPAIEGDSGDAHTFAIACRGRDLGFSPEKCYGFMSEIFNPRCLPPWPEEELLRKVENAYAYATGTAGGDTAEAQFKPVEQVKKHEMFRGWDRTESGLLKKTRNNIGNFFMSPACELYETIAYDSFTGVVTIHKKLPWREPENYPDKWSDLDSTCLALWLSNQKRFDVQLSLIDQAVEAYAQTRSYHPLRDYLNGLEWDGVDRLESFLIDHAKAEDNAYIRAVSKMMLMQAVNRALRPGCKADYVVVFESAQGKNKSQMLQLLGGDYYADIILDTHNKDTIDAMRGKWIIEMAEMEVTRRADAQALKAFLTRSTDRVRLAYGRRTMDLPRSCVFSGTINPEALNQYLVDPTGNRRFMPLCVGTIDLPAIGNIRDQLFAEAVKRLRNKEKPYITNTKILAQVEKEQAERACDDPWENNVLLYLETQGFPEFTTTREVWARGLQGSDSSLNKPIQRRIAQVLKKFGYERGVKTRKGHTVRGYKNVTSARKNQDKERDIYG